MPSKEVFVSYPVGSATSAEIDRQMADEMLWREKTPEREKRLSMLELLFTAVKGTEVYYQTPKEKIFEHDCDSEGQFQNELRKLTWLIEQYNLYPQPELFFRHIENDEKNTKAIEGTMSLGWKTFKIILTWYIEQDVLSLQLKSPNESIYFVPPPQNA